MVSRHPGNVKYLGFQIQCAFCKGPARHGFHSTPVDPPFGRPRGSPWDLWGHGRMIFATPKSFHQVPAFYFPDKVTGHLQDWAHNGFILCFISPVICGLLGEAWIWRRCIESLLQQRQCWPMPPQAMRDLCSNY